MFRVVQQDDPAANVVRHFEQDKPVFDFKFYTTVICNRTI